MTTMAGRRLSDACSAEPIPRSPPPPMAPILRYAADRIHVEAIMPTEDATSQ